ncbi:MAG: HEAT repeat domain-containing protein [Anaerolineae bacterium]|nr:HEAT repeat domain-containing protein [Anaerolineae bacterium]
MNYHGLPPSQLVDLFADKTQRNAAIVALIGGLTATELRRVSVSDAAKQALITGLKHPNSKVRWWCIQLMDHVADESYLTPLLEAAKTDATPKNRRHALHALTCEVCKPDRCALDIDIRAELATIAHTDPDASVRLMARQELAELNAKKSA